MSQFLEIAEQLMREFNRPMSAKELTELGLKRKLFSDKLAGATPWQTMKSKLSVEVRRGGGVSRFIRTNPGRFFLRELADGLQVYEATPWEPPATTESVMVFPSSALDRPGLALQGVTDRTARRYASLLQSGICTAMPRSKAEGTEEYKQILTYILVRREDRVLAYRRGVYNHVEQMLRGADCIGFGGHVTDQDRTLFSDDDVGLFEAAARELKEELKLPDVDQRRLDRREALQLVGFLNDDSSDVGRKHFAALFIYETSDHPSWDQPQRGENSINQLRWVHPADPLLRIQNFEYWSQLALRQAYPKQVLGQPTFTVRSKRPFRLPHLLVLVGPLGSGKTQAARALRESFGYVEINSGRVLASLMNMDPVPQTPRDVFQAAAGEFIRRPDGPRRLAAAIHAAVSDTSAPRVLVDGIRHRATLEHLKELSEERRTATVFVHTPPDVAYSFYRSREQPDLDIKGFLALRSAAAEAEVESLIGVSDAVLHNWAGKDSYQSTIDRLMHEVGIARPG
jgi:predicted NUDIX family phosphoesterase/dephospho-CoA kinase